MRKKVETSASHRISINYVYMEGTHREAKGNAWDFEQRNASREHFAEFWSVVAGRPEHARKSERCYIEKCRYSVGDK